MRIGEHETGERAVSAGWSLGRVSRCAIVVIGVPFHMAEQANPAYSPFWGRIIKATVASSGEAFSKRIRYTSRVIGMSML
ncbi:MAG: hypothetical protein Tsb009_23830 [Planctomycetaceae bacterium]